MTAHDDLAADVREWLQANKEGQFHIVCQRCNAPFEHEGHPVAAPAEWYGVLESLSELVALVDTLTQERDEAQGAKDGWRILANDTQQALADMRCDLHGQHDHYHCERCGCPVFDHEDTEHVCPPGFLAAAGPAPEREQTDNWLRFNCPSCGKAVRHAGQCVVCAGPASKEGTA